jgi:uncharacterized protein
MNQSVILETILQSDPLRRQALEVVARCGLPNCWIGAGFVRDAVWDHLHGYPKAAPKGDVDVIWFCSAQSNEEKDHRVEQELRREIPELRWSVKNQARMHIRNDDAPYTSIADAMRHWPETCTAIAVRLNLFAAIEVNAPFGLDDLFALRLRPTPAFQTSKLSVFEDRVSSKHWVERYPRLALSTSAADEGTTAMHHFDC